MEQLPVKAQGINEVQNSKLAFDDGNLSDASDLPLHGQQAIEGLEFDDDCLAVQTQNAIDSQKRNSALRHSTPTTSNTSIPTIEENADLDIPFAGEDDEITTQVNSHPPSPSSQNSAINAVATIKIPSMTQVYELASSVGTCIEPLSNELGPNRLEPLTGSIIKMLNILETTVQQANQLQQICSDQIKEVSELRASQNKQARQFSDLQMEYELNITRMSEQLEMLQHNHDSVVNDWSFNDNVAPTVVEENLANALRQAHKEIDQLKVSQNTMNKRHESQESNTTTSGAGSDSDDGVIKMSLSANKNSKMSRSETFPADQERMNELLSVLKEKNMYKQKCFALEDEIRELKGESIERMSLTTTPSPNNTGAASPVAATNYPAALQLGQTIGNISQNQLTRKLSTYFRGFVKDGTN